MGRARWVVVANCLAALALAWAACAKAPPPAAVTLTLNGLNFNRGAQLREDVLDGFTHETGIRVALIPTWGTSSQQHDQARRLLERRSATPDIFLLDIVWIGGLASHLLDLAPFLDEEDGGHLPELFAGDRDGARVVALPFYASVGMLHYRQDLLERYGYAGPPATWDELEAMAARIQEGERARGRAEFWGYVFQGAAYEGLTCNALEWQASHGGGLVLDASGQPSVVAPGARRSLERARRWIGSISPPGVLYYREDDSAAAFQAGRAAFLRHWNVPVAGPPASRVEVGPLPAGPSGRAQVLGGFHLAVSRYSAHPREAARLVRLLAGRDVQKQRAILRGFLPTRTALLADPDVLAAMPQASALAPGRGILRPSAAAGTRYAEVSREYHAAIHAALSGTLAPERALAGLEARLAPPAAPPPPPSPRP